MKPYDNSKRIQLALKERSVHSKHFRTVLQTYFVIGTPEQQISNPFPAHTQEGNRVFNAVHGKLLAIPDKPWNLIVNFFNR